MLPDWRCRGMDFLKREGLKPAFPAKKCGRYPFERGVRSFGPPAGSAYQLLRKARPILSQTARNNAAYICPIPRVPSPRRCFPFSCHPPCSRPHPIGARKHRFPKRNHNPTPREGLRKKEPPEPPISSLTSNASRNTSYLILVTYRHKSMIHLRRYPAEDRSRSLARSSSKTRTTVPPARVPRLKRGLNRESPAPLK